MLKKTITYENFDGEQVTEELQFNLTKTELTEMNLAQAGGLDKFIERIVQEEDQKKIYDLFKDLVVKAYGKRSDDGKRFIKIENGHSLGEEFTETAAFDALMVEMLTSEDAKTATEFITGIIPKDIAAQVKAQPNAIPYNNPAVTPVQ